MDEQNPYEFDYDVEEVNMFIKLLENRRLKITQRAAMSEQDYEDLEMIDEEIKYWNEVLDKLMFEEDEF